MPTGLKAVFDGLISTFNSIGSNSFAYDELVLKMDADVVLKKVLHPGSIVGIGNAKGYLDAHMKPLTPSLNVTNSTVKVRYLVGASDADATYALVSGDGVYLDQKGKSSTPVSFILHFGRNSASDEWSVSDEFAYPTGSTTITP
jgi:hypothetical protein